MQHTRVIYDDTDAANGYYLIKEVHV